MSARQSNASSSRPLPPSFTPDPTAGLADEFARLALFHGWKPQDKRYHKERAKFYTEGFNTAWGTDASKLSIWQALCQEVRIEPVPESITKCKKELQRVHVNIVDLVDSRRNGTKVRRFDSHQELKIYTRGGKVFPKKAAKKDGFLKALLRAIFN
ncbi:MAG: hypothetical protein M1812_002847 [Candelaria pacifica]|nr:MAG: hypothetical protein M1812_002847 [Candelaria pacifica]